MERVATLYGCEPNRAGFAKCPFHSNGNERTGSMKIYQGERGWHCFSCHAGGSVIDFTMALFKLDFRAACARLNADFHLGLDLSAPVDTALLRAHRAAQGPKKTRAGRNGTQYTGAVRRIQAVVAGGMDEKPGELGGHERGFFWKG